MGRKRRGRWNEPPLNHVEALILLLVAAEWAVFLWWSGAYRPLG